LNSVASLAAGVRSSSRLLLRMAGVDFLPVCDLLFNLISLTCYFCDVVFTSMVTYTLYDYANTNGGGNDDGQGRNWRTNPERSLKRVKETEL
jgi:hypothetical protein